MYGRQMFSDWGLVTPQPESLCQCDFKGWGRVEGSDKHWNCLTCCRAELLGLWGAPCCNRQSQPLLPQAATGS